MSKRDEAMKFISRLGNGWTVRVALPKTNGEKYIYSRFLDKDYGSKNASLSEAQKQRHELLTMEKHFFKVPIRYYN